METRRLGDLEVSCSSDSASSASAADAALSVSGVRPLESPALSSRDGGRQRPRRDLPRQQSLIRRTAANRGGSRPAPGYNRRPASARSFPLTCFWHPAAAA
jgi:hypothetical protein